MSRILLTTIGSLGDLHPKLALGLGLRERGHDVIFATHQEYQARIEALGFEFHRIHPDNTALADPQEMARMMDLKTGSKYVIQNWLNPCLRKMYEDLTDSAKDADLIIAGEGAVAARLVAEKLGNKMGIKCHGTHFTFLGSRSVRSTCIPISSKISGFWLNCQSRGT